MYTRVHVMAKLVNILRIGPLNCGVNVCVYNRDVNIKTMKGQILSSPLHLEWHTYFISASPAVDISTIVT